MAFIGLPFYGYCPITVTTNDDGSETESLGAGDSESSELWAGDRREQRDSGSPSAKLTIDRSYLSLADEAELGGHSYDKTTDTLERKENDTPALVRVAALGKLRTPERKLVYRLTGYYRASFNPVNENLATATKGKSYGSTKLTGSAECNALTALKTFLNIKE